MSVYAPEVWMQSKLPLVVVAIAILFGVIGILFFPAPPAPGAGAGVSAAKPVPVTPAVSAVVEPKKNMDEPPEKDRNTQSIPEGVRQVEAYWSGRWWPAELLERNAGQMRVHIFADRGRVNQTLWVADYRVRMPVPEERVAEPSPMNDSGS